MLLISLKGRYTWARINSHTQSKKGMLLSFCKHPLLDQANCWLKHQRNVPRQSVYTSFYVENKSIYVSSRLDKETQLIISSSPWELDDHLYLDCAPTFGIVYGKQNTKATRSKMANTSPTSQSTNATERFQAWKAKMEIKQKENEQRMQSLL